MSQQIPAVTVIIPVYRAEEYILETLESVRAQTFSDYEVILVNDGSPDHSARLIRRFIRKNRLKGKFTLLRQKNAGVSAARNRALSKAKGKYIYFLDADDLIVPDALRLLYEKMEEGNDLVLCDYERFDELGSWNTRYIAQLMRKESFPADDPDIVFSFYVWNKMFRREIIERIPLRFSPLHCFEDGVFVHSYFLRCQKTAILPQKLVRYRRHSIRSTASISQQASMQNLTDCKKAYAMIRENMEQHLSLSEEQRAAYLQTVAQKEIVSLFNLQYKFFWKLAPEQRVSAAKSISRLSKALTTAQYYALSKREFCGLSLLRLPQEEEKMRACIETTVALYSEEEDISALLQTVGCFVDERYLCYELVFPQHIYGRLPDTVKKLENVRAVAEYGRNCFYNRVLRDCKNRYILFADGHFYYRNALHSMTNALRASGYDFVTAPVYELRENAASDTVPQMTPSSKTAFSDGYERVGFCAQGGDLYDAVLGNKLFRTDFLNRSGICFDGYESSCALYLMRRGCYIRLDADAVFAPKGLLEQRFADWDIEYYRGKESAEKTALFVCGSQGFDPNLKAARDRLWDSGRFHAFCYDGAFCDKKPELAVSCTPEQPPAGKKSVLFAPIGKAATAQGYDLIFCDTEESAQEYRKDSVSQIVRSGALPFELELLYTNKGAEREAFLARYAPQARGRQIIVVTSGMTAEKVFGETDFSLLYEKLRKKYFMLVFVKGFGEYMTRFERNFSDFVWYQAKTLSIKEQILLADVLVTSRPPHYAYARYAMTQSIFLAPNAAKYAEYQQNGLKTLRCSHWGKLAGLLKEPAPNPFFSTEEEWLSAIEELERKEDEIIETQ